MNILLTGASGFAGAHMLKYLLESTNHQVYCPVTYRHGGHKNRISSLISQDLLTRSHVFHFDLATESLLRHPILPKVDLIINYASESHVDRSISNPNDFTVNNSNLMINLLEFARQSNPKMHFIHISTDEVYGALPFGETNSEWERIYAPSNPYSASKAAQETLAIAYFKTYQLPIAIINSTNMIGEAQNVEKFLPKAIFSLMHNLTLYVDTDNSGKIGSRKYVDAVDVAKAVWMASIELQKSEGQAELPLKFHVAGSRDISNQELIDMIGKVLMLTPEVIIRPSPRPGYDLRYELSTDSIKKLGWTQEFPIEERISGVVNWTIRNPEWLLIDHTANQV